MAINMIPEEYLDALLSLPDMTDLRPQVSRDGKWVAWTWYRTGPAADVYAAPTDGATSPFRLTDTPENTILVSWTPDSRAVLVEQDRDGNERTQLFRVDLARPLEMIPYTEPDPSYYLYRGQLHPNGRWLVYSVNFDVQSGKEIEPSWIYRHDLVTGERIPLAKPAKSGFSFPELSPTGDYVLYTRHDLHPAGRQTWLVDIEGREDREILNFGAQVKTYATWFPDGKRALVLVDTDTHRRLGIWQLVDSGVHWLMDDPSRDIEDAYAPFGCNCVVVLENRKGRTHGSLLDPETGFEMRLPDLPGALVPLAPIGGDEWVGWRYHSCLPTELVRFSIKDPRPETFTSLSRTWERTSLTPSDFTPANNFYWHSVDGLEIHGWLYRPKGPPKGTIVYVHGGPTWHSQDWINPQIQFYARQGFNVLDPNYRGSTGYGLPFREAIKKGGWGSLEQEDIRTGIEALIEAGIATEGKVGITGTSYGGYSSWFAITQFPREIVAAAAPICGMTDLVVDYDTTRPDMRPYSEEMMGGNPQQVPERYYQRSPIHFVRNIKGRLLIVQGAQDPNVTPENVRQVVMELEKTGIPYELLSFDDEGHGISKTKNRKVSYPRLAEFFERAFSGEKTE